jgi:hypothetical protein
MRMAEARLTRGAIDGRDSDIDDALAYGHRAFQAQRQSVPHLIMVGEELRGVLEARYPGDHEVAEFSQRLRNLTSAADPRSSQPVTWRCQVPSRSRSWTVSGRGTSTSS